MTSMDTSMKFFTEFIQKELQNVCLNSQPQEMHIHPPTQFLVHGCLYCTKYGNVFNKT